MNTAQADVFDTTKPAAYHCHAHCVRGALLCGSGRNAARPLEQRQDWIEHRVLDLCGSFAVGVLAWAIMDDHHHLVLVVDPLLPQAWSDSEVAQRWCRITQSPATIKNPKQLERQVESLQMSPERLRLKRQRLGSLSCFMRFLNEGIARRANREDGCRGHFWEGRPACQKLPDAHAMMAAMAYTDLSPIRAGKAAKLADCRYTTLHRRLKLLSRDAAGENAPLRTIAGPVTGHAPDLSQGQYIDLLDWLGRQARPGKAARNDAGPPSPADEAAPRLSQSPAVAISASTDAASGWPSATRLIER